MSGTALLQLTCQMTKNHTLIWLRPGLPLPSLEWTEICFTFLSERLQQPSNNPQTNNPGQLLMPFVPARLHSDDHNCCPEVRPGSAQEGLVKERSMILSRKCPRFLTSKVKFRGQQPFTQGSVNSLSCVRHRVSINLAKCCLQSRKVATVTGKANETVFW